VTDTWQIRFFRDRDGISPVREFIQNANLRAGELKKIKVRLRLLSHSGLKLIVERSDLVDKLEDKLYELRIDNTVNNPRIIFCVLSGKRIFLLHAFKKKTQKTPKKEITIARHRYKQLLEREQYE